MMINPAFGFGYYSTVQVGSKPIWFWFKVQIHRVERGCITVPAQAARASSVPCAGNIQTVFSVWWILNIKTINEHQPYPHLRAWMGKQMTGQICNTHKLLTAAFTSSILKLTSCKRRPTQCLHHLSCTGRNHQNALIPGNYGIHFVFSANITVSFPLHLTVCEF